MVNMPLIKMQQRCSCVVFLQQIDLASPSNFRLNIKKIRNTTGTNT